MSINPTELKNFIAQFKTKNSEEGGFISDKEKSAIINYLVFERKLDYKEAVHYAENAQNQSIFDTGNNKEFSKKETQNWSNIQKSLSQITNTVNGKNDDKKNDDWNDILH